jgi:hypothetical protein
MSLLPTQAALQCLGAQLHLGPCVEDVGPFTGSSFLKQTVSESYVRMHCKVTVINDIHPLHQSKNDDDAENKIFHRENLPQTSFWPWVQPPMFPASEILPTVSASLGVRVWYWGLNSGPTP